MPALVPLEKAAAASALFERIGNAQAVSETLGMPRTTVNDIVNGYGRWCEISTDASFVALRQEQKRLLQAAIPSILGQALVHIEEKLPLASAASATYIFGVLSDKLALLNGESTVNVSVHSTSEVANLDQIAEALRDTLLARSNKP